MFDCAKRREARGRKDKQEVILNVENSCVQVIKKGLYSAVLICRALLSVSYLKTTSNS